MRNPVLGEESLSAIQGRQEFTVRGLVALTRQINEDPSLVESDWRTPFLTAFELSPSQNAFLDTSPERSRTVQEVFRLAASQARNGYRLKLRIVSDLTNDNRRILQLKVPIAGLIELADRTIIDETTQGESSLTFPIVCCCADCCCWHWCDPAVNPCAS